MARETPILILAGATASGKSAMAEEIAEKTDGVIINADSQQVYRELRILTARPTPEAEARLPHRLYGFLAASEACSAGTWLTYARMEIDWVRSQGRLPIVTGGTGLYLNALIHGLAEIPPLLPEIRTQAKADYIALGGEGFYQRLQAADPQTAAQLRPTDSQRLIRAWEVWLGTGKPLCWWQRQNKSFYDRSLFRIFKVELERDILYQRIDSRFDIMLQTGAIEEVNYLLTLTLSPDLPAMRIIGVPEISAYLRGEWPVALVAEKAKQHSRNYAKRQLTWFRNQLPDATPISGLGGAAILNAVHAIQ